jgi:hypothetical protein
MGVFGGLAATATPLAHTAMPLTSIKERRRIAKPPQQITLGSGLCGKTLFLART